MTDSYAQPPQVVVDGVDIDAVHHRAGAVPGVHHIGGITPGGPATYLPGRRVPGLRVSPQLLELEVVAAWPHGVRDVALAVQRAVAPLAPGKAVHVTVTDIAIPEEQAFAPEQEEKT